MKVRTGVVTTANGSRYLQQLCKHWNHKFAVEFCTKSGKISLQIGEVDLLAAAESLTVTLRTYAEKDIDAIQNVVEKHLNRFAFREAPLPFTWIDKTA
ncbi:MAG: DUF2218 domain-containing protein [Sphingomonas sp.]